MTTGFVYAIESGLAIDAVVIGDRYRKEMGDLQVLADSMADLGLMQPIAVTPENKLIDGERRLRAAQMLGWDRIPAHVADIRSIVLGEHAANDLHLHFTVSERVAIAREVEVQLGERRGRPTEEKRENIPAFAGKRTSAATLRQCWFAPSWLSVMACSALGKSAIWIP
jgi:hypothetical protein